MRVIRFVVSMFLCTAWLQAQVLAPEEIRDPGMRDLQKKYFGELRQIADAASKHSFPYRFYFSRALDLTEKEQQASDQRAIQFDRFQDKTVVKITGNYFASYSTEIMKPEERARQTYQDVMLPLLEAAVPAFSTASVPDAFAFEVSHHIRKKLLGVPSEGVENVVLILPKTSAVRLMTATSAQAKQAAVLEGQAYLNAVPIELWPGSGVQRTQGTQVASASPAIASNPRAQLPSKTASPTVASVVPVIVPTPTPKAANLPAPQRDGSPDALKTIQNTYQATLDRIVQELNTQAHFVRYAPPAFIPFHKGFYLQLSVTTVLPETAAGSQYRLAALAFDQHVVHLIRPVLEFFKEDHGDFDGIDFSTSVRLGDKALDGSAVAVEFVFPLKMLQAYKEFDCTGQQLIDSGFVLINGERVSLDLQVAEALAPGQPKHGE